MHRELKNIYAVVKREIRSIAHDVNLISVLLLAPLFYSFFYGSIYYNKIETDVPIAVVDMDHSDLSQKLIRMLDASQLIKVYDTVQDLPQAKNEVDEGSAQGVVFIPKNFESGLKSGKGTDLKIYLNTTRFLISNDLNKAINEVIATMGMGVRLKYFQAQGYSFEQSKEMIEPVHLDMRPMFNFTESYGDFLIVAILVLIIHQTLMFGLSESVAKERELNTLHELFEESNNSVAAAIMGKGLFYVVLYSAYSFFFFTINFGVFKIRMDGNGFALALITLLMLVSITFISIFISSYFKRKIFALQFLTLTSYPLFLISGYSWPSSSMPVFLQLISYLIPLTPFFNAYQRITQMGAGWNDIVVQIFHLLMLCLLGFTAAYLRMRNLFNSKKI
jgi:ABC-2 type transport system permease protein